MIYVSIVLFFAGSLIGALAGNFSVIIVGRTIQGLGGGGLIALTEMVVADLVPLQFRGQWFSLLSAMWYVIRCFDVRVGGLLTPRYTGA
jgi:MFS family permease